MDGFVRKNPQLAAVLAGLILRASFAGGLPADAATSEGEAGAAEDTWAGVRISDAYDYAECLLCGEKNELRAEHCSRCGYELPQPSALMADPAYVFVPGRGYYPEGTLLQPGKSRKGFWVTGVILAGTGLATLVSFSVAAAEWESPGIAAAFFVPAIIALGSGVALTAVGLSTRSEPVYAFERSAAAGVATARERPGSLVVGIKVELAILPL